MHVIDDLWINFLFFVSPVSAMLSPFVFPLMVKMTPLLEDLSMLRDWWATGEREVKGDRIVNCYNEVVDVFSDGLYCRSGWTDSARATRNEVRL